MLDKINYLEPVNMSSLNIWYCKLITQDDYPMDTHAIIIHNLTIASSIFFFWGFFPKNIGSAAIFWFPRTSMLVTYFGNKIFRWQASDVSDGVGCFTSITRKYQQKILHQSFELHTIEEINPQSNKPSGFYHAIQWFFWE